ncbi:uncharacterized protein LOC136039603 [Artemia franciscana]|uniref:uncharacterized protein LOC136039603 n=1 Tax=Artemia franciscana TaxID=6661 RepID=UPI0032DA9703
MERTTTEKPEREARGYSSKFQWLANIGRGIHFFFLMSVSIIHNLTWVHFKPPSTASPILVTQFEIVQGTCNTAINIWKTLFFSIDVLSEEKVLFIVTQILTAIIFESYVPRLLFWCHPPLFSWIAKFIVTFLSCCTWPISWGLAWILENIVHGSFKEFWKSLKSEKSESQQEGEYSTEEIPDSTEENVGGTESGV